jgi:hypothetical protein
MPGFVVHVGAIVQCLHAGIAQPVSPFPRVMVSAMPVVTLPSPWVIAGCALSGTSSPFCVSAQFITGSMRVMAGGAPLVLIDSQAVCAASGTGVIISSTQTRVVAQ